MALLGCAVLSAVVWVVFAFGSSQGSLTERLLSVWQISRSDLLAQEIGHLKAKIELLESSMQMIQDGSDRRGASEPEKRKPLSDNLQPSHLEELQVRAQKIALSMERYSAHLLNSQVVRNIAPVSMPIEGVPLSSNFGWRNDPLTGDRAFHSGIDWMAPAGAPVLAVSHGVVHFVGSSPSFGTVVEVRIAKNIVARYAHLQGVEVTTGMPVVAGQRIARVGSTGRSTGTHLHFEMLVSGNRVNPESFFHQPQAPSHGS